jgi:hypothetical protein
MLSPVYFSVIKMGAFQEMFPSRFFVHFLSPTSEWHAQPINLLDIIALTIFGEGLVQIIKLIV